MTDEINESQADYSASNIDSLKAFVDTAVSKRVDEINNENIERLERFRLDAIKNRNIHTVHFNDKPDPKLFDTTDNLKVWYEKSVELEGKALKLERQYVILKEKLELQDNDLIKRTARKDVAKEYPEIYQQYQNAKKLQTANNLKGEWKNLESKLDDLIAGKGSARDISSVSTRLNVVVERLENSEAFKKTASKESLKSLQNTKSKIEKSKDNEHDSGLEL